MKMIKVLKDNQILFLGTLFSFSFGKSRIGLVDARIRASNKDLLAIRLEGTQKSR